eukprot:3635467-Amphidinium_carterae.1
MFGVPKRQQMVVGKRGRKGHCDALSSAAGRCPQECANSFVVPESELDKDEETVFSLQSRKTIRPPQREENMFSRKGFWCTNRAFGSYPGCFPSQPSELGFVFQAQAPMCLTKNHGFWTRNILEVAPMALPPVHSGWNFEC